MKKHKLCVAEGKYRKFIARQEKRDPMFTKLKELCFNRVSGRYPRWKTWLKALEIMRHWIIKTRFSTD